MVLDEDVDENILGRVSIETAAEDDADEELIAASLAVDAQTRIRIEIAAAQSRGNRDFLDQLGESLAALGVARCLLVLDRAPFGMTGHGLVLQTPHPRSFCRQPGSRRSALR